jgi:hypothetical protein
MAVARRNASRYSPLARRRDRTADARGGLVVHHAAGTSRGLALGLQPGGLQRLRVRPSGVTILGREERGIVRHQLVEFRARRPLGSELLATPTRAEHPRALRLRRRAAADLGVDLAGRAQLAQAAAQQAHRAGHRVRVRVVEPRQHHAAAECELARVRPGCRARALVVSHVRDATVADHDRLGPGVRGVERVDLRAGKEQGIRRCGLRDGDEEHRGEEGEQSLRGSV